MSIIRKLQVSLDFKVLEKKDKNSADSKLKVDTICTGKTSVKVRFYSPNLLEI